MKGFGMGNGCSRAEYAKFLRTPFWIELSSRKKAKVGKCERCGADKRLQSHHKEYPDNWFDSTEEMLEVVCSRCHRLEHGYVAWWEEPFEKALLVIKDKNRYAQKIDELPTESEFRAAAWLSEFEDERRQVEAVIRDCAGMRMMFAGNDAWGRWLKKPVEVKRRQRAWASRRFLDLRK